MSAKADRGFAGAAPGQKLENVVARLTRRDLETIIGPRVLPLVPSVGTERAPLEAAAVRALTDRAQDLFARPEIRLSILRNLDDGKLHELKSRLPQNDLKSFVGSTDIPDLTGAVFWPVASGFFGLLPEERSVGTASMPRQPIVPSFQLFEHQRSVVRRGYARLGGSSGTGRTIVHMPTGAGKTRTAMHLVSRILNELEPCVVVWLATSRELLEQAAETFEMAWASLGNRTCELHRCWGNGPTPPVDVKDGIVVAGLAKMHAWLQRDSISFLRFASRVRFVVMDEAHQAIAPTYKSVIETLCGAGKQAALLGLTATPGRTWNDVKADQALSDFFEGSKVVLEVGDDPNPVRYLLANGYLARPKFGQISYRPEFRLTPSETRKLANGDDFDEEAMERLAADTARNLAILTSAKDLVQRGHLRVILFATSVEHAKDMAAGLASNGVLSNVVSGETPQGQRASILRTFKSPDPIPQVLCNYGVLTTGFDAPRTSAAIIARPTKSLVLYSQMVGRATRGPKAGGNETCEILTVHDPAYPGFGDIAEAFFNWEDVWNDDEPRDN
ncbi:DEAD/DEAH box helicase [Rhizobium leguminosarum]|uniref:DEAD/DEAH box helicase n=1 Tax=Rhizobium leguminosarum TaxID=384 RepID=UPI0014414DE4|nr:DEAD/DEAH box helicase [Rhizobium leguminosarum]MBY5841269.1 DEAD/DEAH box helicase [Rhizobium leguminosarum]NKM80972.1 DEAD/DEAH box helicase [Rhizobium leguminosarum bv. viciae]QSZ07253.1 DEAD/DEAH box helicase [Rhizobium leguminosarum]